MVHANPYLKYYQSQIGGGSDIPVFIGGQHGEGIGDFFRSVLRRILPIALRGLSTFATSTMRAHEGGASLKDAARSAITPSLGAMASAVQGSFADRKEQSGSGGSALFSGVEGVPFESTRVYKGLQLKRKHKRAAKSKRSKKQKVHNVSDDAEHGYNF
jgi:hypothetical protein